MDQNVLILLGVVVIAIILNVLRKSGPAARLGIDPAAAKNKLDTNKNIILLDVRTKAEYLEKHIPNSLLIPIDSLNAQIQNQLPDKNTEIIVYCRSGSRSSQAVRIMLKLGYSNVWNLGAITAWPYGTVSGDKK